MDYNSKDQLDELGLQFDNDARRTLFEASKWARLISIVVFIGCGLFLLLLFFAGSRITSFFESSVFATLEASSMAIVGTVIGILLVLVVATYYFLFHFSTKVKQGLVAEDTTGINAGFGSLKIYFIITSVIAIISLVATVYQAFVL